jgi:two-component sensor histidine kinase
MSRVWAARRLRFATEAAGIALWSWNADTGRMTLDDRGFDLWGLPRSRTVRFEDLTPQIHPADLSALRAVFAAARHRAGAYETDFRIIRGKDIRWISACGRGDDRRSAGRIMYGVFIDITVRKRAQEECELVVSEMHHRIKNLFTMASALAAVSSRTTKSKEAMTRDLSQRLAALSDAHDLILIGANTQSRAGELRAILELLLKPHVETDGKASRLTMSIPKLFVGTHSASAIALIVHELATNSIKYGALGSPAGKLSISGHDQGSHAEIVWRETGGPPLVAAPRPPGFGSKLVMASVKNQLGGSIEVKWPVDGIVVSLKLSKARLAA